MSAVDKVLEHVQGVQKTRTGFKALCPAHDDHNPSLHIDEADDGSALVKCWANCSQEDVLAALEERGCKRRDLFADAASPGASVVPIAGRSKAPRKPHRGRERLVKSYHVNDASKNLKGIHERWEDPDDPDRKSFKWKLPNGRYSKGDIKPEAMPLYGSELVADWPEDYGIVVGEGETPAEAMRSRNIRSVGTVCGAGNTPNAGALEVLRGRRVILWPDNDKAGREHMRRVGRLLQGVAASVQWYEWTDAPEKGDGADHPAVKGGDLDALKALGRELRAAPVLDVEEIPDEAPDDGRILLGRVIEHGIEPPAELVEDLLLAGKVHSVYSAASTGKTFVMLWLVLRVIERGLSVLIYDRENGPRIMAERLEQMGANPADVDRLVHYHFYPDLPTTEEGLFDYEAKLDEVKPALAVFDSWINFLAANGLDENSSNDVSTWAAHYAHPARRRGAAVLLLDHVPKEGLSSRGSSRKKDEVDVMWSLRNPLPFDRDTVGRIVLQREKDREGWLPESVGFSVGGGADGFVFRRSSGTFEVEGDDGLTPTDRKTLEALDGFGPSGPKAAEWQRAALALGVPRSSFYRSRDGLKTKGEIFMEGKRYFRKGPISPKEVSLDQTGPAPEKVPSVPHPLGVGPSGTGGNDREIDDDLAGLADMFERDEKGAG